MNKKILTKILKKCWDELIYHRDGSTVLYASEKEKALSWQWAGDDEVEVSELEAKDLLEKWIKEQYTKAGWVFLYTCKDNALVSVDMDIDTMDEDEKDMMQLQEGYGKIKFMIGYD